MNTSTLRKAQLISSAQTIDLRNRVLRGIRPIESCYYAEDALETTFHFGIIEDSRVISNGTFLKQPHPKLAGAQNPYRLRGMATDPAFQKQGLGQIIIEAALNELRNRAADLLWFNARTSAEGFYRKLGFDVIDEVFDMPQVGPHKVMYKWL